MMVCSWQLIFKGLNNYIHIIQAHKVPNSDTKLYGGYSSDNQRWAKSSYVDDFKIKIKSPK